MTDSSDSAMRKVSCIPIHNVSNGMKGIADYIHSLGLKAGIYSEAGANTCGSLWDGDKNGIGVGLYGFEHQDANLFFNEWGFDFIKIDYCGAGQQLDLEEQERYTEIVNAIREVCPRNISLNICRWAYPGTWVSSLARSWRISGDINPSWESVKYIIDKICISQPLPVTDITMIWTCWK